MRDYDDYDDYPHRPKAVVKALPEPKIPGTEILGSGERASDLDRERVIDHLEDARARGYLDKDETCVRIEAARESKTKTELQQLVRDVHPFALEKQHRKMKKTFRTSTPGQIAGLFVPWLVISILTAVLPAAVLTSMHHEFPQHPLGLAIGTTGLVIGIISGITSLVWMITRVDNL